MPYTIQGQSVSLSTDPILHQGKHYIPLREMVEALGGSVTFDNATKVAEAIIGPWTARVTPDTPEVPVSGNGRDVSVTLTALPLIHDGVMYVPFDFLEDAYGYQVNLQNGTLNIVNPNA